MFEHAIMILEKDIQNNKHYIDDIFYKKNYPIAHKSFIEDNKELQQAIKILQEQKEVKK